MGFYEEFNELKGGDVALNGVKMHGRLGLIIYDTARQKYTIRNEIGPKLKFEFVFVLTGKNMMSCRVMFVFKIQIDLSSCEMILTFGKV